MLVALIQWWNSLKVIFIQYLIIQVHFKRSIIFRAYYSWRCYRAMSRVQLTYDSYFHNNQEIIADIDNCRESNDWQLLEATN